MAYYAHLFSPATFEAFSRSDRTVTGFTEHHRRVAQRVKPGDIFICYMIKLSRWVGVLEVVEGPFIDRSPVFYPEDDPYVVRFRVKCLVWLPLEKTVPIHDERLWDRLSFTRELPKDSLAWTGKVRGSLGQIDDADGRILETVLQEQAEGGKVYAVDRAMFERWVTRRVRREGTSVTVTVPDEIAIEEAEMEEVTTAESVRESIKIQALLAEIGTKLGFKIWIPMRDRDKVLKEWQGNRDTLIERLPLNYDEVTLKTIEQIDVLWLKGRAIKRAFEVEHTTSIYSGLLRMADLLALQPNMDIKLHIVAPASRREKVFQEITRPVFSLLERGPLSETCTYLSYDSIEQLAKQPHLSHLQDSVIEEYEERPEE